MKTNIIYITFLIVMLLIVGCSRTSEDNAESFEYKVPYLCHIRPEPMDTTLEFIPELATDKKRRLWKKNVLAVYFFNGNTSIQKRVLGIANEWSKYGNIKFVLTTKEDKSDIRVDFREPGFNSEVGTNAIKIPNDKSTMSLEYLDTISDQQFFEATVLHEFGHALGFIHEHQRKTASIPWNKPAVYKYHFDLNGWDTRTVDEQVFKQYSREHKNSSKFDPYSIMIYEVPDSLTLGHFEIGWNFKLSDVDKSTIQIFYP
jgi:Astacin (Peptidase family M12A)